MYLGLYSEGKIEGHKFKLLGQTLDLDEWSNNLTKKSNKNLVLTDAALAQKVIQHQVTAYEIIQFYQIT